MATTPTLQSKVGAPHVWPALQSALLLQRGYSEALRARSATTLGAEQMLTQVPKLVHLWL